MHRRFTVSFIALTLACTGASDTDDSDGMSSAGESGGESGSGACDESRQEPVGCDDVQFPGDGTPRTAGVVLSPDHRFYASTPHGVVEFYGEEAPVCGDTCACENEDFVLLFLNSFEGPGIYSFQPEVEHPVVLTKYDTRDYLPETDECAYQVQDVLSGTVEIVSVGQSCVAGIFSDLPAPFDVLEGPWMAGSCE